MPVAYCTALTFVSKAFDLSFPCGSIQTPSHLLPRPQRFSSRSRFTLPSASLTALVHWSFANATTASQIVEHPTLLNVRGDETLDLPVDNRGLRAPRSPTDAALRPSTNDGLDRRLRGHL